MTRIIVAVCGVFTETLGMFTERNCPMPVTVELRGGPLCGTLYTIKDITCPLHETVNGIRYTYRAVRLRKNRPVVLEMTWAAIACPERLAKKARRVDAALGCDEAERRN